MGKMPPALTSSAPRAPAAPPEDLLPRTWRFLLLIALVLLPLPCPVGSRSPGAWQVFLNWGTSGNSNRRARLRRNREDWSRAGPGSHLGRMKQAWGNSYAQGLTTE